MQNSHSLLGLVFDNLNNFLQFWNFLTILTIFTIFYNFDNFNFFYNFDNFLQLTTVFTIQTIAFAILTIEKTILETCDIWDTDYNSDNWEPEFMTIFVTWQLIVTLDSIRNSCDVLYNFREFEGEWSPFWESYQFWGKFITFMCPLHL